MKIKKIPQSKYKIYGLYSCCGPVCLEMVLKYFNRRKNALQIYSLIEKNRKRRKEYDKKRGGWTYPEEHIKILNEFGLKLRKIKKFEFKPKKVVPYINKGMPIIINVKSFRKSRNRHFVIVNAYNNGRISINDPENIRRSPIKFSKFMKHILTWNKDTDYCGIAVTN